MAGAERGTIFALAGLTKVHGEGPARVEALRGVDLAVEAGEPIALLGPSGSGRSTLLDILGSTRATG